MMNELNEIKDLLRLRITLSPEAAKRFFKTSEGRYGAGDEFLGITVPELRKVAKIHKDLKLKIIESLLESKYNEERLLALLILVYRYQKAATAVQKELCRFYITKLDRVNNWNLVDASAYHILGHYLFDKDKSPLHELALSEILWNRRISIVSTWYFIRNAELEWTFKIAKLLQNDRHDLIHKAVGWMLREAGKKDESKLISFLSEHAKLMPKTMLRYATERLSSTQKAIINYDK